MEKTWAEQTHEKTPDELLTLARMAAHNGHDWEANHYWMILDHMASAGKLPLEWRHF